MNRFKKEKETRIFNKYKFLIRALYFCVFILCALQIIVSNSLTTSGDKIARYSEATEKLRFENKILEEEIAKTNSLNILTNLASQNGFVKSTNTQVLTPALPVAQGRLN
jgi:hypothetical protein